MHKVDFKFEMMKTDLMNLLFLHSIFYQMSKIWYEFLINLDDTSLHWWILEISNDISSEKVRNWKKTDLNLVSLSIPG